ncbi:MAG TPA: C39 family peptidase [Pseudomonadales bacterium]
MIVGRIGRTGFAAGLLGLSALLAGSHAAAGEVGFTAGGARYQVAIASFQELRFRGVVRQTRDFSCGSAAVATLLSHHYRDQRSEEAVFTAMFEAGDQQKIRAKGFSLLDMKRYLEREGYAADGFRLTLDQLVELGVPAIALVETQGYSHFVVVKAVDDRRVLLADPAIGNHAMPRRRFEASWNGIFFIVRDRAQIARQHFNEAGAWAGQPDSPLAQAVSRSTLSQFALDLPVRRDY